MSESFSTAEQIVFLRDVGSSPTGEVWAASRRRGARTRPVAVKVIAHATASDLDLVFRMRDRGRALATLGDARLVPVEDVVRIGHKLGFVVPWVDGMDLLEWSEILREHDVVMPGRVVCEILADVAAALDVAQHAVPPGEHECLGYEHRDLKPSNIMIRRDGGVRVLDLGTGYTAIAGRNARAGALQKGLVKYLSPTRRDGKRGGPPADVYALGLIAVELFRGRWLRRLHVHNPAHDRHLAEVVARLEALGMRTPADDLALRNALLRMVAWDPEGRPTAGEAQHLFRTLGDRAPGPSLKSFAMAHLMPFIPEWPGHPEAAAPTDVELLGDDPAGVVLPSPPAAVGVPVSAKPTWEETEGGWKRRYDQPDDEEDPDEEDITLLTPPVVPARALLPPPPAETERIDAVPPPVERRVVRPWLPLLLAGLVGAAIGMGLLLVALAIWWNFG